MRAGRGWVVAIAGVSVACAVAAVVLLAIGSAMMAEADAFFGQFDFSQPVEIDDDVFLTYNSLYTRGSALATTTAPLLLCTFAGIVTLLAVLAARRDARRQTGAPAAS
jgi:hypothetical protein